MPSDRIMAIATALGERTASKSSLSVGQRIVAACSLGYAFVFLAALILRPGSKHDYEAFFNSDQNLSNSSAGFCRCLQPDLRKARQSHHCCPAYRLDLLWSEPLF